MEKDITETQTICDFCEFDQVATHKCLTCGRDICLDHTLAISFELTHQRPGFSAYLCPICSKIFEPVLLSLSLSKTWAQIGYNPEYNQARLKEILAFIDEAQEREPVNE